MKRSLTCLLCALTLALSLAACVQTPSPETPTPPADVSPAPAEASPAPAGGARFDFKTLPVTEEGVRTLYGWEGYEVAEIIPYEGDYLVEYGYGDDFTMLAWVFGETGRRVQLTSMTHFLSYEIIGAGRVAYTSSGVSASVPWKGLPETCEIVVLGDETGRLTEETLSSAAYPMATWLDPAEPFSMGFWENGKLSPGERYEQLYDARIDADGLSFSFIPSGDSAERFRSFFPASTTIPCFDTSFDPDSRVFTLRLYNTCLESGGITEEELNWAGPGAYAGLYPCAFPAGSLGRDSHFITDAEIREDGEDTVVTCKLTERACRFTVETSNLGGDSIPSFRMVFRAYNSELDGREAAE